MGQHFSQTSGAHQFPSNLTDQKDTYGYGLNTGGIQRSNTDSFPCYNACFSCKEPAMFQ